MSLSIPQPRTGWPLIGQALDMARDPLAFFSQLQREHGDIAGFSYGRNGVLASHPDDIERVLHESGTRYDKGYQSDWGTRLVLGNGLVTSEGAFWKQQRTLMQPAFHGKRINAYAQTMVAYTQEQIAGWQPGASYDIQREMLWLTQRIVAQVLFGRDVRHEARDIAPALDVLIDGASMLNIESFLPPWLPTPGRMQLRAAVQRVDAFIHTMLKERRAQAGTHNDLLDMLMQARDENGQPILDQQLRDELVTLYLAGHETTSNALSFSWLLLGQHPEVRKRLEDELADVLAGRLPEPDDLRALRYADAIIKESMRLYPPVWAVSRVAREAVELSGYTVPAGTEVVLSQWITQRDARWYADPLAFRPERWLDGSTKSTPKYAYFPFGGGPRVCIGNSFAQMEAVLLLATIAARYRLRLVSDTAPALLAGTTLRPRDGIMVVVEPRSAA